MCNLCNKKKFDRQLHICTYGNSATAFHIIIGFIDNNKSFYPIGFITCDNEDVVDFLFVLSYLKQFDATFKEKFLLADVA